MSIQRRTRSLRLIVAGASLLLAASLALAKIPGFPGSASKTLGTAKAVAQETSEQARARVQKLLDEVRAEDASPPDPVPTGVTQGEIEELRDARLKMTAAYDVQLRALEQVDELAAARRDAEARARDWTGFDTPPPYSIVLLDQLRTTATETGARIRQLETSIAQLKAESERAQEALRRADQEARRATEAFDSAVTPEAKALAAWRRKLADVRERSAAALTAATLLIGRARSDMLGKLRAEHELLERQIGIASQATQFTETELATARKLLTDKVATARRDLASGESQIGARLREREAAAVALAALRARKDADPADIAGAQARIEAADAWISARRDQNDSLRGLAILNEEMATLWDARYTSQHGADGEARRIAEQRLREAARQVISRKAYVQNLVRDARVKLSEVETRIAAGTSGLAAQRYEQDELTARREAALAAERLQNELDSESQHLTSWVADLDTAADQRDWRRRAQDGWVSLRAGVENLWNFELFAVEDTMVTDGQTVTVSRGVTVGKSIGAVLIFLFGLIGMVAFARGIEKRLVARGYDAARARTGKRWMLALLSVLLLLLTLNVAKIPVTVFAFLGGALAIGAGFGTQTLIKNLVSGMVLMMERQVRVGDVVDVDNVSGTITEVNLRSSTVRSADGTEAIVPNSVFVENKVTNWTHSDNKIRRVVRVGVAYGSPVRDVAGALEECAKRHGLILGDPPPLVIFEDFGDNALVFALFFWVELRPGMSSVQVMSDLRFMIEKKFAEGGIVLAYPQRDIHLDVVKPLRIELLKNEKTDPPA